MSTDLNSPTPPLRWAILEHTFPYLHWDFLLERSDHTAAHTWRLLRHPCCGEPIAAEPIPDHRLVYFEYEGEVSGGRGHVRRLEAGQWHSTAKPPKEPAPSRLADAGEVVLQAEFTAGRLFQHGRLLRFREQRFFWEFSH
jgi:hypothetical protein